MALRTCVNSRLSPLGVARKYFRTYIHHHRLAEGVLMAQGDLPPTEPSPELAYEHLLGAVERRGLSVSVVPDHLIEGLLARINMQDKTVAVASSVAEDLEQLVIVLAHELAHAL